MEHKIINTKNYLIIVYESDIAHLPLNNSPILEGVDLLPPIEDGVEKLAKEQLQSIEKVVFITSTKEEEYLFCDGFEIGYNKAKEKYKYTEEDIMKAVVFGYRQNANNGNIDDEEEKEFIQSLQQPKMPVKFKCYVEKEPCTCHCHSKANTIHFTACCDNGWIKSRKILTTTTSEGITQWIGEYIY